jgi:hypothetical protein
VGPRVSRHPEGWSSLATYNDHLLFDLDSRAARKTKYLNLASW